MAQSITARSALFWLFQRITGAFLAVFLFTHVKVLHWDFDFTQQGLIDFAYVIDRLQGSAGWLVFYFLFIISALFHGLNGLWAIVLDFRPARGSQLIWLTVLWLLGILTAYYALQTLGTFYKGGPA
jgi:succinate dehydrogenase/fumarate reductase cytochrome b subunit